MDYPFLESHIRALYRLLGHRKDEYTDVKCIDVNAKQLIATALLQGEDTFVEWAKKYNGSGNVFVGRNPRSIDRKVCRIGCFTLDLDPIRAVGTAATEEMVRQCRKTATAILAKYRGGLCADSGNGVLLVFRVQELKETFSAFDQALGLFQDKIQKEFCEGTGVICDRTQDAARLIKVIGTMSTKGDKTQWRISKWSDAIPHPPYKISSAINGPPGEVRRPESGVYALSTGDPSPTARLKNAEDAMARLNPRRAEDYYSWLSVGMSLKEFGDVGLQLWRQWSKRSDKYQDGVCETKWPTFRRDSLDSSSKLTIGTVIKWANEDSPILAAVSMADHAERVLHDDLNELSDTLAQDDPVEWLAKPFVARGSIVFTAGLPETLKTWIMADLAVETARGGKWLGVFPTTAVNVLFLDQERFAGETNRRMAGLLASKGLVAATLKGKLFVRSGDSLALDSQASVARLCRWIEKRCIGLVVVDSFATTHRQDENNRIGIQSVLETVKSMRDKYKCSFVFIDHENKMAFSDKRDEIAPSSYRMVGSVGKVAAAEAVMVVKRTDNDSAIIYHTKSTLAKAHDPVQVRIQDVRGGVEIKALG